METKLKLITKHVTENNDIKLTSIVHLINETSLKQAYQEIPKNRAVGIDEITAEEYGKDLIYNIAKLVKHMKDGDYYPQPSKRIYIDKGNGKKRPLGLPSFEDKLVDKTMAKILNAIYEPLFLDCSYGFRPNRNAHQALKDLNDSINFKNVNYIIDADIKGFFDNVNKTKLKEMIQYTIVDKNFNKLVSKFLKAGIIEQGKYYNHELGVPQGGVSSPIYANIYLHYVLDLWFEKAVKRYMKGYVKLIRYCDDFLILVENKVDTELIMRFLKQRLLKFDLELSSEKTRVIELKRDNDETDVNDPRTFDFLGFTHYGTKTRNGKFRIGRKTIGKRMSKKLKELNLWLRNIRNSIPLEDIWKSLNRRIVGYFQYYAVSDNLRSLKLFMYQLRKIIFKWINRRSDKTSMNWNQFNRYLNNYPLPKPKIIHNFFKVSAVNN